MPTIVNVGLSVTELATLIWTTLPVELQENPRLPLPYVQAAPAPPPTQGALGNVHVWMLPVVGLIRTIFPFNKFVPNAQKNPSLNVQSAPSPPSGSMARTSGMVLTRVPVVTLMTSMLADPALAR